MEITVNIVDTLFDSIPKGTVVANYVTEVDTVNFKMYSTVYSIDETNKAIVTTKKVDANNLEAIHFDAINWVTTDKATIDNIYPKVVSKYQNKFKKEGVIYKITKDYDLNNCILTIPDNCTLQFEGGSFSNGTIDGHDTKIISELRSIFKDEITITGTWDIIESYPEWFGAKSDGVTDNTYALQVCINYFNVIKLGSGTYVTNRLNIPSFKNIIGEGKNSIIKANSDMPLTNSYLIRTKDGGSGIRISNLKIICGNTSNEDDYKIGGIGLISTANANNDQWDTRNIIENVEILNCYAASIYIGTYQRENKIQNCFISNTTNNGINCQGTDNMINGCTIAGSHLSGIMLQGNNRLSNTKLFGCGKSEVTKNLYALDIFGSKCNVSNIELQQNYYGGVIVRGNSNYVQVTNDNNGSGNIAGTSIGASIIGNYNTVIVTSYNFSFHNDAYERYFVSTNWSTIGNNIIVNGTPLKNNKMSSLSPWSIDNICNNINWNGYNLTQDREVSFDKLVIPYKYRTNGTGSFYTNDTGLSFKIASVTAVNVDALSYSIPIYNATKVDPDGCFSIKARFHKNNDADDSIYPVIRINTTYKNGANKSITRTDQNTIINLLDNKDSLDVYALSSYHHLSDKAVSISSISIELAVRSTKVLSGVSIDAYFDDIKIGATTSGDTVRFANTNIDGTSGNKVVIANEASDFILENVIYKVVSDINLNTSALEIPANCTLDFQGGSFSNGTLIGSNTKIEAGLNKIFDTNIILNGSWNVNEAYPEWFGEKTSTSIQLCLDYFPVVKLGNSTYTCSTSVVISNSAKVLKGEQNNTVLDFSTCSEEICINVSAFRAVLQNVVIKTDNFVENQIGVSFTYSTENGQIENVIVQGFYNGININKTWYSVLNNIRIRNVSPQGYGMVIGSLAGTSKEEINNISFNNIWIEGGKNSIVFNNIALGAVVFDTCTFESTQETALKTLSQVSGAVSFKNCYFEKNYLSTNRTVESIVLWYKGTNDIQAYFDGGLYRDQSAIKSYIVDNASFISPMYVANAMNFGTDRVIDYTPNGINATKFNKRRYYNESFLQTSFNSLDEQTISLRPIYSSFELSTGEKKKFATIVLSQDVYYSAYIKVDLIVRAKRPNSTIQGMVSYIIYIDKYSSTASDQGMWITQADEFIQKKFSNSNLDLRESILLKGKVLPYNASFDTSPFILYIDAIDGADYIINARIQGYRTDIGTNSNNFIIKEDAILTSDELAATDARVYNKIGITNNRPLGIEKGFEYYDTTLSKYICWNGTTWTNLDGSTLT